MKYTLLTLSALLIGCGTDTTDTTPDNTILQPDAQIVTLDTQPSSATVTTTTTRTETTSDAGSTPDSLPPAQTTPDALVQVTQPDTLPQATPDAQPTQQPDALPMAQDTLPAAQDTLVLVDTKPATPDVLPAIDTLPVTTDTLPTTQPEECGGDNQACCLLQVRDKADAWIHTCVHSVNGTYDCTIPTSIGAGPSGTCLPCGYKGYPGCTAFNIHGWSGKWMDILGGTCDHDGNQNPVCTGNICLCP